MWHFAADSEEVHWTDQGWRQQGCDDVHVWFNAVLQTVKEFIEKIKAGGNTDATLYMYPGEGHGFMNGGEDIHKKMKSE